ncbi:hypothetical protein SNE25_30515 [Mucilaginibacter sabulilitoris]|uniref:DUF5648 domain-containing protein n=1 Tax=Mucilaginibacter sabulilitoris TaxID=1173583 RepID=A0ABZ0TLF7_9SPHI|nr:hypothetical protein [Mucilaginibacter sabulilitoris]WPU93654.1 hypothetical protein SNE25_30515 [Mucilaginibacter sabulilitoris]
MKPKLNLLLAGFLIIITSCQKSNSNLSSEKQNQTAFEPIKISYKDTTSVYRLFKPFKTSEKDDLSKLELQSASAKIALPRVQLTYKGNGTYDVILWNNQNNERLDCTYTFYSNGIPAPIPQYNRMSYEVTDPAIVFKWETPAAGNYKFVIYYHTGVDAGRTAELPVTIYNQPVPPPGRLALYRYINPYTGHHIYTTNWQELASGSQLFVFEKVQGYILPSSGPNTLLIYRYYNRASDDHWLSTSTAGASGYVREGGVGYIDLAPTSDSTLPLIEYFSTTHGHAYVTPPETLPAPDVMGGTLGYLASPQ